MNSQISCIGVINLNRAFLERHALKGQLVNLRVIGCVSVGSDVTPELVQRTVSKVSLRGKTLDFL